MKTIMEEIVDSYFHCFRYSDHQNMTLFLGDLLEHLLVKAEPYTNLIYPLLGISKTGLISCWLKKALRPAVSCYNHVDKDFYTMLEYIRCSNRMFKDKSCFQMYSRIYGSTPDMLRQSKGIFICFINELLIATTAC
ncbi:hypothetical protein NFI96_015204 [Prochilodus magdalenae]|nr:hypothetical protein NFI96_015204 [Prochilodus magdalenae]